MNARFCGRCGKALTSGNCALCNPMWTCACGYAFNSQSTATCAYCRNPPSSQTDWSCVCGYQHNLTPTCLRCGYQSRQLTVQLMVKAGKWVCDQCGFDRNWAEYNTCKMCRQLNSIGKYIKEG